MATSKLSIEKYDNKMPLATRIHPGFQSFSRTLMALSNRDFECSFQSEPLKCTICSFILREPHTVSCCKQNFCKSCIEDVKEQHKSCPSCNRSDFIHYPNGDLHEVLLQFEVYCTSKCGMRIVLQVHDSHLNINPPDEIWLQGCPKVEVRCIYCKSEVKRRQAWLKHLEEVFDPSKVEDIHSLTSDMVHTKWFHIGDELKVAKSTLDEIQQKNAKTQDCYNELLQKWIESTGTANWLQLLLALRNRFVGCTRLSKDVERSIVCDKASEQKVKQLKEETKKIKKEYHTQRNQLALWAAELESKWSYLEDKKKELEQLKFSRSRTKQQGEVGEELSQLIEQLKLDEEKISSIENEVREGIIEKKKLMKQIAEGERQLKNTRDRMNACKISLMEEIKHLEWEENVKLIGRDLGKSKRIPYLETVAYTVKSAGVGAGMAGTAAAALGFIAAGTAGGLILAPLGVTAGAVAGAAAYLNSERRVIDAQYTRLIKTCADDIDELKSFIDDGDKLLQNLKEIVKKAASDSA